MENYVFGKIEIYNMPDIKSMEHGFVVVRQDSGKLWFWGIFSAKEKAEDVAIELGNGVVIEV